MATDTDLPTAPKPERVVPAQQASFRLHDYELPLLYRIRQVRKEARVAPRRFLIEVENDKIYLTELPTNELRAALA